MNAKTFKGLVASLIATLAIFVSTSVVAKDGIGAVSFDASAKKVTAVPQSTVTVYRTAQGGYTLSPTADVAFTAYAPGPYGLRCGRVDETTGQLRMPVGKMLITNANFCLKMSILSKNGTVAPSGTKLLLEVWEGAQTIGYTTSWAVAQQMVAERPGAVINPWAYAVPAETKGLWVANANPSQADPATGLRYQGSYFDFTREGVPRTDYPMGSFGFLSVDNSRQAAYFTQGMVRVNILKSATNNPLDLQDNTPLLTSLVDEVTGKLVIVEGGTIGGGVWIQDPANPFTTAPSAGAYLRPRDVRNESGQWGAEIIRAQLFGEWLALWRGTDSTSAGYTKGQLIVYNIRDWIDRGVRTSVTVQLPDAPAIIGPVKLGPPAFDPVNRRFWVNYGLQRAYGSVTFSEDFSTATVGDMKYLSRNDGEEYHSPVALYFDSAMGRLYVASHRYGPASSTGFLAGEVAAYAPDGETRLAVVRLPNDAVGLPGNAVSSPSDMTVMPRDGKNMIVVSSSGTNTIVIIDPDTMQTVQSLVTLKGRHVASAYQ